VIWSRHFYACTCGTAKVREKGEIFLDPLTFSYYSTTPGIGKGEETHVPHCDSISDNTHTNTQKMHVPTTHLQMRGRDVHCGRDFGRTLLLALQILQPKARRLAPAVRQPKGGCCRRQTTAPRGRSCRCRSRGPTDGRGCGGGPCGGGLCVAVLWLCAAP
jgi:hypothetical protein